jgi:hypothetical protein
LSVTLLSLPESRKFVLEVQYTSAWQPDDRRQ